MCSHTTERHRRDIKRSLLLSMAFIGVKRRMERATTFGYSFCVTGIDPWPRLAVPSTQPSRQPRATIELAREIVGNDGVDHYTRRNQAITDFHIDNESTSLISRCCVRLRPSPCFRCESMAFVPPLSCISFVRPSRDLLHYVHLRAGR